MSKTVYFGFNISTHQLFFNKRGLPFYSPVTDIEFDYTTVSIPPSDKDIGTAIKQYAQNHSRRKLIVLADFEDELFVSVQKYVSKYLKKASIKQFSPKF